MRRCALCRVRTRDDQEEVTLTFAKSYEAATHGAPHLEIVGAEVAADDLHRTVLEALDDGKAEDVVAIDLTGKSALADTMIVASGRSDRHVGAIADRVIRALKDGGFGRASVEGLESCDWVLIDAGNVVVHLFRPEVRSFYNLEKMWSAEAPAERLHG